LIVRRIGGVGVVAMEFLQAKGLVGGDPEVLRRTHFGEEERPIAVQIYGSDAATMAEAARRVGEMGADSCDVNMGCPANRVLRGCAGAALMGDLRLAGEIVRRVRRAVDLPLTVKFRLGLDDRRRNYLELGRICEAEGADAVVMHGRTARQGFRGEAEWDPIARLKAALGVPVIGNGDVRDAGDAVAMLRATGCDGVMIGRGATRDPWIFRKTAARLSGGRVPEPTLGDRWRLILDHFRTVIEREPPALALHKLRGFTKWYSHGLPDGQRLRRRIGTLGAAGDFPTAVDEHFAAIAASEPAADSIGAASAPAAGSGGRRRAVDAAAAAGGAESIVPAPAARAA
jgi:nifR3 family TIM-barrel protein